MDILCHLKICIHERTEEKGKSDDTLAEVPEYTVKTLQKTDIKSVTYTLYAIYLHKDNANRPVSID